jgi:hypothetical protein
MKNIFSAGLCLLLTSMASNASALVCEIDYEFKVDTFDTVIAQVTEKCSEGDSLMFAGSPSIALTLIAAACDFNANIVYDGMNAICVYKGDVSKKR